MSNFDQAFAYTVGNEGGYSDNPYDSGGPTNWGITQAELSAWRGHPVSAAEVRALEQSEAKAIYRADYWNSLSLDRVSSEPIALCMFDIGVVCGTGIAAQFAQEICNERGAGLTVDRAIGPLSIHAINETDALLFVPQFAAKTESRFRGIVAGNPSQSIFLQGWLNRAHRLLTLLPTAQHC